MTIIRNEDGTLVVPVRQERHRQDDETADDEPTVATAALTRVLHPGEGGYDEALVEWDLQQNPDREPAVSTPSGRQEAMAIVHAMAESPDRDVSAAIETINDPEASGEVATSSSEASTRSRTSPSKLPRSKVASHCRRTRPRRSSGRCSPSSIRSRRAETRDEPCRFRRWSHERTTGRRHVSGADYPWRLSTQVKVSVRDSSRGMATMRRRGVRHVSGGGHSDGPSRRPGARTRGQ